MSIFDLLMEDVYKVIWRGIEIGLLDNAVPDMGYLEGNWIPNDTAEATQFGTLVAKFNASVVIDKPQKGTRVVLQHTESTSSVNALVISLSDGRLFVRRVFDDKAIKWLTKNVK